MLVKELMEPVGEDGRSRRSKLDIKYKRGQLHIDVA